MKLNYGLEVEWADVRRDITPPGTRWSMDENHVVNVSPPYTGIGSDPLGIDPPVGGELNFVPVGSPAELEMKVLETIAFFDHHGCHPSSTPVGGTHIHISSPDWTWRDWIKMVRLAAQFKDEIAEKCALPPVGMMEAVGHHKEAKRLWGQHHRGNGMRVQHWMADNVLLAKDEEDFYRRLRLGVDGKTKISRPSRKHVNFLALNYPTKTVEFRPWGSTASPYQITCAARFINRFVRRAITGIEIDLFADLQMPQCRNFSMEVWEGWLKTKKPNPPGGDKLKRSNMMEN